jgi:hypothetical protein
MPLQFDLAPFSGFVALTVTAVFEDFRRLIISNRVSSGLIGVRDVSCLPPLLYGPAPPRSAVVDELRLLTTLLAGPAYVAPKRRLFALSALW